MTAAPDELQLAVESSVELGSPPATAALVAHRKARQPVQELLVERLARLDEMRRYAASSDQAQQDLAAQAAEPSAASDSGPDAAGSVLASTSSWIEPPYLVADGLAGRYQFRLRVLTIGVYAAAAAAVGLGALAAILFPFGGNWNLAVVFEAVVLVALLTVQWLDLRKICRDRWVAFRAMSEYMRIGRYLALVSPKTATGLDFNRVVRLNSWSSEPSLTPWFAPVLERLWDRRPDVRLSDNDVSRLREYILTDWVDGQIKYHAGR